VQNSFTLDFSEQVVADDNWAQVLDEVMFSLATETEPDLQCSVEAVKKALPATVPVTEFDLETPGLSSWQIRVCARILSH